MAEVDIDDVHSGKFRNRSSQCKFLAHALHHFLVHLRDLCAVKIRHRAGTVNRVSLCHIFGIGAVSGVIQLHGCQRAIKVNGINHLGQRRQNIRAVQMVDRGMTGICLSIYADLAKCNNTGAALGHIGIQLESLSRKAVCRSHNTHRCGLDTVTDTLSANRQRRKQVRIEIHRATSFQFISSF